MSNLFEEKARSIACHEVDCFGSFGHGAFCDRLTAAISAALVSAYEMGCQAGSIAKGDGSSEPTAPLQSGISADAYPLKAELMLVPALLEAASRGLPPDVQELLVHGNVSRGVQPGILLAMLRKVPNSIRQTEGGAVR